MLDLSSLSRTQHSLAILANYFSENPQPFSIEKPSEFYHLYPNFDFEFYIKAQKIQGYDDLYVMNHYHMDGKYHRVLTSDTIKIVFYTPPVVDDSIGGINAIYRMAQHINNIKYKNIRAYIYSYDHKRHGNKYCNNFVNPFEIDKNTFVVYPETIEKNPLNAKNVIRWILLDLGNEMPTDHYKNWSNNDLVYFWEPSKLQNSKQLSCPWIDAWIRDYKVSDSRRKDSSCFMMRKTSILKNMKSYTVQQHPKNSKCLDGLFYKEILLEFIHHKYFYSYDPNTFYNLIAPLCGCVTILHPIPGVTREEYFNSRMTKGYMSNVSYDAGIAYGYSDAELAKALKTLPLAKEQALALIDSYKTSILDMLIDIDSKINRNEELSNTVESIYYGTNK